MGLDSLFKPKGKLMLQSQDNALPGDIVPFDIRVIAEEEIEAREIRAEMVGEEAYYVTETHRDSKGHVHTRTVERTNTFTGMVQTIAGQPALHNGTDQKWNSSMQLPQDAPPTSRGKVVNIRWTFKAVLDVPKKGDLSQEKPLNVFSHSRSSEISIAPAQKSFGEVTLSLLVPPAAVASYPLKGQLTLNVKENLNIRGIRAELVQVEEAGTRNSDDVISKSQVSGDRSLSAGESLTFEFSLDIPASAPPTSICARSRLGWKVRAVLDRKMKTDFSVEQEVAVYNALKA
jgi:hypothetical protein